MEISKLVKELGEKVKKTPITMDSEIDGFKPKSGNVEFCNRAFQKICHLWNNTDGSRKFIKHLIEDFAFSKNPKIVVKFKETVCKEDNNRCAILGIKLAEIEAISRMDLLYKTKEGIIRSKMEKEGRTEYTQEEKTELRNFLKREFPIEVRNLSLAVYSTRSEKFLSIEALYALKQFIYLAEREPEINHLIEIEINKNKKKKAFLKRKEELDKKQKPSQGTFNMSKMMDDEAIKALEKIK